MKRKYFFLIVLVLLVCIGIIALCRLLPDDVMALCVSNGYCNIMETHVPGAISQENIEDLLQITTVKKGASYRGLPSPCIEIRAVYDHDIYVIVVGADNSVSVAPASNLDFRTFWVDTSGKLYESLYSLHLENGGTEFP